MYGIIPRCIYHSNRSYPSVSRASPKALLTIQSAAAIVTPPLPHTITKGQVLHLSCKIDGNPYPTVAWFKKLTAPRPGQQPEPIVPSYHISFDNAVSIYRKPTAVKWILDILCLVCLRLVPTNNAGDLVYFDECVTEGPTNQRTDGQTHPYMKNLKI